VGGGAWHSAPPLRALVLVNIWGKRGVARAFK